MKSDVLFALSDTGGGHRSVAVALASAIDELSCGTVKSRIDDLLWRTQFPLLRTAPKIYERLTADYLRIYNAGFVLTNSTAAISALANLVYRATRNNLVAALRESAPELVVVTHPFLVAHLICRARQEYGMAFRVVTVVTDPVSVHASWTCRGVDSYIVFGESARHRVEQLGIPRERIAISTFPVHPSFFQLRGTKEQARHRLGLSTESFTVLIAGGGAGSGIPPELPRALEKDCSIQVLVVTGSNVRLHRRLLKRKKNVNTRIFARVENMADLMKASDVIVTKAGPSTLMEAAALNIPVIITGAVGNQEVGNIELATNNGFGVVCKTFTDVLNAVHTLRANKSWPRTSLPIGSSDPASILLKELGKSVQRVPKGNPKSPSSHALP